MQEKNEIKTNTRKEIIIGTFLTIAGGILWGISGVCGQFLFQNKDVTASWLVPIRLVTAGFLLLRIEYAPLWAMVVSLVDALPILGTGTILVPWALVCLVQHDTARAIGLLGIYAATSLTRSTLEPRFVGRQLGLDPLVTLISLYVGFRLWGIAGMMLAPLLVITVISGFSSLKPAE